MRAPRPVGSRGGDRFVRAVALGLLVLGTSAWSTGERSVEARPTVRVDESLGLALEVRPARQVDGALAQDTFVARALALHVARGESATPFVAPGPFTATWTGSLDVPQRDDYVFSAEGRGSFTLEIDGEVVLDGSLTGDAALSGEKVRLKKGLRALVARYRTPLSGAGSLQVSWSSRKFATESIPPTVLRHDPASDAVRVGEQRRQGRMLLATQRCTACHETDAVGMPELSMRGPSLVGAGARLDPGFLAAWIEAPHELRASARMPDVLPSDPEARAADVADLAAFLAGLGADGELVPSGGQGDPRIGARLFGDLGCFSCHGLTAEDDGAWISLHSASQKFRQGALASFLQDPGRHEPWIRMPDLKLTPGEAEHLEAFLREQGGEARNPPRLGDAVRGAARFVELGCARCHDAGIEAGPAAKPLDALLADGDWSRGCMSADPAAAGSSPRFRLSAEERASIAAFAAEPSGALTRDSAADFATRQVAERRCTSCHVLDGQTATWVTRESDMSALRPADRPQHGEGHVEVAQLRPALTLVGEKLRLDWMTRFLAGEVDSPRPWLHARMPRLNQVVASGLAAGLAAQHGLGADEDPLEASADRVAAGRSLIVQEGGFGCVTCHAVGDQQPKALFEVQGINLAEVASRLRSGWYRSWMLDPPRFEAAAKMPKYADDSGRTALPAYGGDARQQFDAIWHFVHGAEEIR
jgi:mono/diheme cytochrome c family protein